MDTNQKGKARAPIVVTFAGKEYEIPFRDSREWRKKVIALMARITVTNTADLRIASALADQVMDLFFEYAKNLNREEIETVATGAEVAKALGEVARRESAGRPETMAIIIEVLTRWRRS